MDTNQFENVDFDPASMATSSLSSIKAVWYKRPWVLITFVVVLIIGFSVLSDLPHPLSTAQDAAAQNASIKQINADIAPCAYAVVESLHFYAESINGTLTPAHRKVANTYLTNDQTACSFASSGMSDLTNNLQVLDTAAGKNIDRLVKVAVTWMDSDANGAIFDVQYLLAHPGDAAKIADLQSRLDYLAKDRALVMQYLSTAQAILGSSVTLNNINLPTLAALPQG